ncbi:MAG: flagellar brake protein [Christensenellales bacterium]
MSINEKFVLGEIFEITVGDEVVRTKLQEIISDTEFVVLRPTLQGIPIRSEDDEFTFRFNRSNGCYSFKAKILDSYRQGNIWLSRVERISEMERSQRRQYYRLPIVLDIVVDTGEEPEDKEAENNEAENNEAENNEAENNEAENNEAEGKETEGKEAQGKKAAKGPRFCKGKTVNISENSVEFTCFRAFEEEEKVVAAIKLTESDAILVNAEVLRCSRADRSEPYCVVLIFDDMSERERKNLRRFILQQQALMLKRRK